MSQQLDQRVRNLGSSLVTIRSTIAVLEGRRLELQQRAQDLGFKIDSAKKLSLSYDKLHVFFQSLGTDEQVKLQRWIEQIITYGVQYVFGSGYVFKISEPAVRGSEVVISFDVHDATGNSRDPYTEMGGGLSDVLSFLLQFVLVHLLADRAAQIIFLDEPCKHLSVEHRPAFAKLLAELVRRTGMQIVIVTHEPLYAESADTVYRFSKPDNLTVVEQL